MACGKTRVPIPLGIDDQRLWEGLDMVSQGICITKPFREPLLRPVRRLLRRYLALIALLLSFKQRGTVPAEAFSLAIIYRGRRSSFPPFIAPLLSFKKLV